MVGSLIRDRELSLPSIRLDHNTFIELHPVILFNNHDSIGEALFSVIAFMLNLYVVLQILSTMVSCLSLTSLACRKPSQSLKRLFWV